MKKITSLFCALMIMMSASAAALDFQAQQKARIGQEIFRAQQMNHGILPRTFKAPSAKQEEYDLTIAKDYYTSAYGTSAYLSMNDLDHIYSISLTVTIPEGSEGLENGKTYTKEDIDLDFSSVYNKSTWEGSGLSDAELTWIVDGEELIHFAGFVKDTLGNTFNFHYDEQPFMPTGETIYVAMDKMASFGYAEYSKSWSVSAYDDVYSISFDLNSDNADSPVGIYTEEDFASAYNNSMYINHGNWSEQLKYIEALINITDANDTLRLQADVLAEDGNVYNINLFYADPKPLYFETIKATNLEVDSAYLYYGGFSMQAASDNYSCYMSVYKSDGITSIYDTYVVGEGLYASLTKLDDQSSVEIFSGSITIEETEEGAKVTGTLLGRNNTEYTIELKSGKPEKTREETLTFDNAGLYILEDYGKWQIWGNYPDSSRIISLSFLTTEVAGTYTIDNIEFDNTYVGYEWNEMGYVSELYRAVEANLTVTFDAENNVAHLTGTMLGKSSYVVGDYPEFTLDITAKLTHAHLDYDTEDADFEAVYNDYLMDTSAASEGVVYVQGANESSAAVIAFIIPAGDTTLVAGSYKCNLTGQPMTVYTGSCDGYSVNPSFFGTINAQGYLTQLWFPYQGNIVVDEKGVIVVDVINTYDRTIKVTLNPKKEQGVENVEKDATNAAKRLENGLLIIEKNGVQYNVIGNVIE